MEVIVSGTRIASLTAYVLVALFACPPGVAAQEIVRPDLWRSFVEQVPVGTTLKIRLSTGERFKATLLQVSSDAITVQPKTRAAVPPQPVPFTRIETLEVDQERGIGVGKAIAIGAGVAGGVWLALMAFAFAVWGD
jgi:hypothetical protein